MKKLKVDFENIKWPEEFVVEYKDGIEQVFISEKGVYWDDGQDLEGEDENRPNISCCWKKKSPSQQQHRMIEFFVDEVEQFKTISGSVILRPDKWDI